MSPQLTAATLAALFGAATGAAYFGILWLTVRRVHAWRRPGMVLMASLLFRLALLGGSIFLLTRQGWMNLGAGVLGLLAAREFWIRRVGRKT